MLRQAGSEVSDEGSDVDAEVAREAEGEVLDPSGSDGVEEF